MANHQDLTATGAGVPIRGGISKGLLRALILWGAIGVLWIVPRPGAPAPRKAAVVSAHPLATAAGRQALQTGGNAFDAAVAVAAALGVVEPYSSGLGGGGFWLLHVAAEDRNIMVDGREEAPSVADRDLYQNASGELIPGGSLNGPRAAGVPGQPAALVHISREYGELPLKQVLAPAIRYAHHGFPVGSRYQKLARFRKEILSRYPTTKAIFLRDGQIPKLGTLIRQPDLARTLERLANRGRAGFYSGPVAAELVRSNRAAGGLFTRADLEGYQVVERAPVEAEVAGDRVIAAAPPSSGGVTMVQILHMLAARDYGERARIPRLHLQIEAMRRAYRDRALYLGDPDFVDIPRQRLLSPAYNAGLAATIHPDQALPSKYLPGPTAIDQSAGHHTTHFSVLDPAGNRVAATLSINYPFGSGFVAGETGVLLNDEMDDFVAKPGVPNAYGLVGGEANAIAPGKQPLSSMTPTFVDGEEATLILGTPGGARIISMVTRAVLGFLYAEGGATHLDHWVARPRFHHQYLPDEVQHEPGAFSEHEREALQAQGHELREIERTFGDMQAILWDRANGEIQVAADPRGAGTGVIFHPPSRATTSAGSSGRSSSHAGQ